MGEGVFIAEGVVVKGLTVGHHTLWQGRGLYYWGGGEVGLLWIITLYDGGGVSIAEREVVEELSHPGQGIDVILKGSMCNPCADKAHRKVYVLIIGITNYTTKQSDWLFDI